MTSVIDLTGMYSTTFPGIDISGTTAALQHLMETILTGENITLTLREPSEMGETILPHYRSAKYLEVRFEGNKVNIFTHGDSIIFAGSTERMPNISKEIEWLVESHISEYASKHVHIEYLPGIPEYLAPESKPLIVSVTDASW